MVRLPDWLDTTHQRELAEACRQWARPPAGMRRIRMPGGGVMPVQTVCLGWHMAGEGLVLGLAPR